MNESNEQIAGRVARQAMIDEKIVFPIWSKHVDIPLLEMYCACTHPQKPVILMPELRFSSLLKNLIVCIHGQAKIMVVDDTDTKFDVLRQIVPPDDINIYYLTQNLETLNYSSNSFHFILTHIGLPTLNKIHTIFSSYKKVLKPDMHIVWSSPIIGSFPGFMDLLEESLATVAPLKYKQLIQNVHKCMDNSSNLSLAKDLGFQVDGAEISEFEIVFPDVESMLFSSLVESHYLAYCLSMDKDVSNPRQLLTHLVRSFHHYFDGMEVKVPMKMGIYSAKKLDA